MSKQLHFFQGSHVQCVGLPFVLSEMIEAWSSLRKSMIRSMPEAFTRDEWAYLIQFLDAHHLQQPFTDSFGSKHSEAQGNVHPVRRFFRPRGTIALWLPNNVSLLGPLSLVMLMLTGNPVHAKGGTQSDDLTEPFLAFIEEYGSTYLRSYLKEYVRYERFSRTDARGTEMALKASTRVVFGSDAAAQAIHALPHPIDSVGFSFADRRSEAWFTLDACTEERLIELLKVFAIYGQAGCTSPARVVLLDASREDALSIREQLCSLWERVIVRTPGMHVASGNVMASQWARAVGWDSALTVQHGAVLSVGSVELEAIDAPMSLPIVYATQEEAIQTMPSNIQTLGLSTQQMDWSRWLPVVSETSIKRLVPVGQMHHFGSIWDGWSYWKQTFEEVDITL